MGARQQRTQAECANLAPLALKQQPDAAVMQLERLRSRPTFSQPATAAVKSMHLRVRACFFAGLADTARLALLDALRDGERTAGEAATAADLSPSNASKHLACLRDCGQVESRQDWRHVHYRVADGVSQILDANDVFIDRAADRIAACQRPAMWRV